MKLNRPAAALGFDIHAQAGVHIFVQRTTRLRPASSV